MKIFSVNAIVIIIMGCLTGCISLRNAETPLLYEARTTIKSGKIGTLKARYEIVLGKEQINGEASKSRILIFTWGDYEGLSEVSEFISAVAGLNLSHGARIAGTRAMESAKADGMLITDIKVTRSGLWPIAISESIRVTGRPLFIKPVPVPREQLAALEIDFRLENRNLKHKIAELDRQIDIVKRAIEKALVKIGCCAKKITVE